MNMLQARVKDGALTIKGAKTNLPLPSRFRNTVREGSRLVAGIRPEALSLAAAKAADFSLPAEIDGVELTGPELVATARIGKQRVTASLSPRERVNIGETHAHAFEEEALHLFDPESGKAY